MRAVVQRVTEARVMVDGELVGQIGAGLCVLVGVTHDDDERNAAKLAEKLVGLRVMADETGTMNRSVADTGAAVLVVSQFTLYGDTRKGRRPSYLEAAPPEQAAPLVERVIEEIGTRGVTVAAGRFGADMRVELTNDGPVTLLVEA
jgi:D-tyrosyl-tRNA(Tyr) deacylase